MRALRANPHLDFSIIDEPSDGEMPGANVVEDAVAPATDGAMDVACVDEPVTNLRGALSDPLQALRDLLERDDRAAPVPSISRRAAKRMRKAGRQVRLSSLTVGLLRGVGALPAPAPVVAPVAVPSYSPALYSGGQASG